MDHLKALHVPRGRGIRFGAIVPARLECVKAFAGVEFARPASKLTCFSSGLYNYLQMPITVELHNVGDTSARGEIVAIVEHVLSDQPGNWRVSVFGSREHDRWEIKVTGPQDFERSYTLEGSAGEHRPEVIRQLLVRMLPPKLA